MVSDNVKKIGAGLRNQRRSAPLETAEVSLQDGRRLRLPTIEETLRIKTSPLFAMLPRDYLDVASLSHHIGITRSAAALERMKELYAEFEDEAGDMLTAVAVKLSLPDPYDLTDIDLSEYKGIVAPWNDWRAVQAHAPMHLPRRRLDDAAPLIWNNAQPLVWEPLPRSRQAISATPARNQKLLRPK
jgi:hypothetical protein